MADVGSGTNSGGFSGGFCGGGVGGVRELGGLLLPGGVSDFGGGIPLPGQPGK